MLYNNKKIVGIIIDECGIIEERCEGYKKELIDVITYVITAERQHLVQGTNIQQKINDKINATGRFLTEKRSRTNKVDEDL